MLLRHVGICFVFQANTFDLRRNQQGFFTFLHKWIVVAKQRSYLADIETFLRNVSHVIAVVPFLPVYAIEKVLPLFTGKSNSFITNVETIARFNAPFFNKPIVKILHPLTVDVGDL